MHKHFFYNIKILDANTSLPEDKEIQGFIPITKHLENVGFKNEIDDKSVINRIRAKRLIIFGLWVCQTDVNGKKLVIMTENDTQYTFEPVCIQPDPTESLLEEMRSVNLVETNQPTNKGNCVIKQNFWFLNVFFFCRKTGWYFKTSRFFRKKPRRTRVIKQRRYN